MFKVQSLADMKERVVIQAGISRFYELCIYKSWRMPHGGRIQYHDINECIFSSNILRIIMFLYLFLLLCPFSGFFSRTAWISWYRKAESLWIVMKQEMMGWQWHQLDYIPIICTSLQTDNHTSIPSVNFLRAGCFSCCPADSVKAMKAKFCSY